MKFFFQKSTLKFFLLIICIVLFFSLGRYFHFDQEYFQTFFRQFPLLLSGLIFIFLYVSVTAVIWVGPKDIFRIAAALVYGAYLSTLLVWISEMISAVIFFNLSRNLGRGFVESKLRGGMKQLDRTIAETGFWYIFILRLFVIPFRFLDIGFGLTKVSFKKYFTIIFIASPLRLFLFQYILTFGMNVINDPNKLAAKLVEHPIVIWLTLGYTVGAVVVMIILKKGIVKAPQHV